MCTAIYNWFSGLDSDGIGNLISSSAAFVAILALFLQSRSTRKQLKLQNFIEYTKRYQEIILHFPENINDSNFKLESLPTDEVRDRTKRYMRAYFDLCFEEYILHQKKFIDKDLWSIWEGGMKTAFSKPAFLESWSLVKKDTCFGGAFVSFVEKQLIMR